MTPQPRIAIRDLVAYRTGKGSVASDADVAGTEILRLAANENQEPPLPAIERAIRRAIAEINRYPDHLAIDLRRRIASWLQVPAEWVAVGCGSVGLLQQFWLTYVDPGDVVVFPWRSFEAYPVYSSLAAARAVMVPLTHHAFDVEATIASCSLSTKLLVLASPNNPTGTALSMGDVRTILEGVAPETLVLLDEAYREYMDPKIGDPIPELLNDFENLAVLRTFSKAYGLAGLRVGYAIARPEIVSVIDKSLVPFAVNGLAQVAAIAAIENYSEVAKAAEVIRAERDRLSVCLRDDGWEIPQSEGNFIYFPLGRDTERYCMALEGFGILTRPFLNEGLRVTIGRRDQNDRFLDALRELGRPSE